MTTLFCHQQGATGGKRSEKTGFIRAHPRIADDNSSVAGALSLTNIIVGKKRMRLERGSFFIAAISSVLGSYLERFGSDPCSELAMNRFGGVSTCDIQSELCLKMFWLNSAKETFVYSNELPQLSSLPLSCSEADSWSPSLLGKRKMSSEVTSAGSSFRRTPIWYRQEVSCGDNVANGLESMLDALSSSLTPFMHRWPLGELSGDLRDTVRSMMEDVEFIAGLVSDEGRNGRAILRTMRRELISDIRFRKFEFHTLRLIADWTPARFDQGLFLRRLAPFVQLYASFERRLLGKNLDKEKWANQGLGREILEKFPKLSVTSIPLFYRPVHVGILEGTIESFFSRLVPRAQALWVFIRHREFGSIVNEEADLNLLSRLEELVSHAMLSRAGPVEILKTLMCGSDILMPVVGFISWLWSKKERRRADRLVFSVVEICKDSSLVTDRRKLMNFLPALMRETDPVFFQEAEIGLISDRNSIVSESRWIIERDYEIVQRDFFVKFFDTLAEGDVGPRAHWFSIMTEEYFQPGKGLFEFADPETQNYLKPVVSVDCPACMVAAGRLIGIGIRYGISVGARLTPCSLALLRIPSAAAIGEESQRIEACVSGEDPMFVASIKKAREFFSWEDQNAAQALLNDMTEGEAHGDVTREFFEAFMRRKLYEKGIKSVRHGVMLLKEGINSVLPLGTLELFTKDEFEIMVNGVFHLSAQTLWNGIKMRKVPQGYPMSEWLKEFLEDSDDAFRFAFNRFVTGNLYPPVTTDTPWIFIDVEPSLPTNALPVARTCFSSLHTPQYADKETFHHKLRYAVLDGTASIDLQ